LTLALSQSHHDNPLMGSVSVLSFSNSDAAIMNPKVFALLLITVPVLASGPSLADDDHHQREDLDDAVRKGEILQLSEILERVKPQIDGKILEIEFENSKHTPIYELYVLDRSGRRLEYEVDARTAKIISLEDDH
jgi:uncharacterized membrane protein YkoI